MHNAWFAWGLLGAVMGPLEGLTRKLWFGPPALAALVAAAVAALGGSFPLQAGVFAAGVFVGLGLRKVLFKPYQKAVINERRRPFNVTAIVLEEVSDHAGRVRFGGRDWAARTAGLPIRPGIWVDILGLLDDNTVIVVDTESARARALRPDQIDSGSAGEPSP